ncbi:MAG: lipoate--protein ligase family protein [Candidatus Heimdallarchaeota archaeon]|nr:lipoate--protein ligase family protein [Candidatus Heimdallarchaeota archaeon]
MRKGRVLEVTFDDLQYNLALEEAIFANLPASNYQMTVRFWQNPKSVVVGRGLNLSQEVDVTYCLLNNIKIGRRISGGGAVFHDGGNLNISFFINRNDIPGLDDTDQLRAYFTELIIDTLVDLGFTNIEKEGSSEILYQGNKISGSVGYLKKEWYLHQATLFHDTNLSHLENSLLSRTVESTDKKESSRFPSINLPVKNLQALKKTLTNKLEEKIGVKFEQSFLSNSEKVLADKLKTSVYNQSLWIQNKRREYELAFKNS